MFFFSPQLSRCGGGSSGGSSGGRIGSRKTRGNDYDYCRPDSVREGIRRRREEEASHYGPFFSVEPKDELRSAQ